MSLVDQIIGVESGGDPNSIASSAHMFGEFRTDARILKLLFGCGPATVARLVVAITVYPVNRMTLGRLLSHIGQEILKTITPTITYFNSARAVPDIGDVLVVSASSDHASPRMILARCWGSFGRAFRGSMRGIRFFGCFDLVTATARRVARLKIRHGNYGLIAAGTLTNHTSNAGIAVLANLRVGFCNDCQLPKSHTSVVYAGHSL